MGDKFKKNDGNQIARKGEEFVEDVLKKNEYNPSKDIPVKPRNRL